MTTTKRRKTARERCELIVREAGPWRASPMVGLFLTRTPEDISSDYNDVLDAAACIINRIARRREGK